MITCPNCKQEMLEGALYCQECGYQLFEGASIDTQRYPKTRERTQDGEDRPVTDSSSGETDQAEIMLKILEGEQRIALMQGEISIGRTGGAQAVAPDIDLTPYNGFDAGVSRMHAIIRISEHQASLTDLGSMNGTRLNGSLISPQIPYSLENGDKITFGRLKTQILIRRAS